jgi:crotonobetainyl-CoA:carnitine CoA-transferase CaiB-like acyl-CoA transferase
MNTQHLPLLGLRVVDLTDGPAAGVGQFLAGLGADVILVEPPEGAASRNAQPLHSGHGLRFATTHANKRGVVADLSTESGRKAVLDMTDSADLVVESFAAGHLARLGIAPELVLERNPKVVVVSVTPFGQSGPYRDLQGGDAVLIAKSSALSRSGAAHREPLLPPGELATETAITSCTTAALVALYQARRTGQGELVDCSLFDLVVQDFDPGLGMAGTATLGRPLTEMPPGRPDARMLYPVVPCADGHVRMFISSPKHWRAMYDWMGHPEELADPSFSQIGVRFQKWHQIRPFLEKLFANQTRSAIAARGVRSGIAITGLRTAGEVLTSDHVLERASFVNAEIAPGLRGSIPNGVIEVDDKRAGFRHRAPSLGEHDGATWTSERPDGTNAKADPPTRPLDGVRVLDLGVIVVGAETGRALADQGADVIKIENRAFVDGARQADSRDACSHAFTVGNRGKRSLGLNLRSDRGKQLFLELVAVSDVVLTNFKPGTLESLGLDYRALEAINPRIILVESSALGSRGPWSTQMGYGPLVRAAVGLTTLWRHPDSEEGFGDDMTVYPDHAAARVGVAGVLAALVERETTGHGRGLKIAQMETVFAQLATDYVRESLEPGSLAARGNANEFEAPSGVYACSGDDAYCAVTVRDDGEWARLATVIGRVELINDPRFVSAASRVDHRYLLDSIVTEWTSVLSPQEAEKRLQAGGVAAGAVAHVTDLLTDPHLAARSQISELAQPGHQNPPPVTTGPALFSHIPPPALCPAPMMAADTREVLHDLLGLSEEFIDELVTSGVVEVRDSATSSV